MKIEPQKPYRVRYRQFKRGRRSTRELIMHGDTAKEIKQRFEAVIKTWDCMKEPSIRHAQLISIFPGKGGVADGQNEAQTP